MDTYKFFFYANILVISILSVTIYLYTNELEWLLVMLLGISVEILAVISKEKKEKNMNKKNEHS